MLGAQKMLVKCNGCVGVFDSEDQVVERQFFGDRGKHCGHCGHCGRKITRAEYRHGHRQSKRWVL